MSDPQYFDYVAAARKAGLAPAQLDTLARELRAAEEPIDDMLFELHLLRACHAIADGYATFDEVMAEFRKSRPSAA